MSVETNKALRFARDVWEQPSLKHAIYIGVFSFLCSALAQTTLDAFYAGESVRNQPESYDYSVSLKTGFMIILVAPVLETLINQVGVIGILRATGLKKELVVWLSACIFAYIHFWQTELSTDVLLQMLPILPTGYILGALYYKVLEQDGWRSGFKYTAVAHATHNGIIFVTLCILHLFDV